MSLRRSKVMREDGGKRVTRTPLMVASTVGRKKREMESILAANRTGMADVVHRMISWQRTHVLLNRSVYFFSRGRRDGRTDMVSMENPLASYCLSPSSTAHQEELLANDDFGDYAVDDALVARAQLQLRRGCNKTSLTFSMISSHVPRRYFIPKTRFASVS